MRRKAAKGQARSKAAPMLWHGMRMIGPLAAMLERENRSLVQLDEVARERFNLLKRATPMLG